MEDNVQDIQHDKIVLSNLFEVLSHIRALNADKLIQAL